MIYLCFSSAVDLPPVQESCVVTMEMTPTSLSTPNTPISKVAPVAVEIQEGGDGTQPKISKVSIM